MRQSHFYIRVQSKVTGPFSMEQVQLLHQKGRLGPHYEVSEDGRRWQPASSHAAIAGLFGAPAASASGRPATSAHPHASYPQQAAAYHPPAPPGGRAFSGRAFLALFTLFTFVALGLGGVGVHAFLRWNNERKARTASVAKDDHPKTAPAGFSSEDKGASKTESPTPPKEGTPKTDSPPPKEGTPKIDPTPPKEDPPQPEPKETPPKAEPGDDWIERVATASKKSVVRIMVNTGGSKRNLGTGFVIASLDQRHLLLTNKHVLADDGKPEGKLAKSCQVVLANNAINSGKLVGWAKKTEVDLALVLVELPEAAPPLQPLGPLADFEKVRVGEKVIAIGHPMGLDYTVTDGIVSAKRENLKIQTNTGITHGNSGGPLVNKMGYVVGVNTAGIPGQPLNFAMRADWVWKRDEWTYPEDVDDLLERIGK